MTSRKIFFGPLFLFLAGILLAATTIYERSNSPPLVIPNLIVAANSDLTIEFVLDSATSRESCQTQLSAIAGTMLGLCKTCKVLATNCESTLAPSTTKLLNDATLSLPVASFSTGVMLFHSANLETSMQACLQAQRSSDTQPIKCHEVGSPRIDIDLQTENRLGLKSWLLLLTAFVFIAFGGIFTFHSADQVFQAMLKLERKQKQMLIAISDIISIEIALILALALRFESLEFSYRTFWPIFIAAPLIAIPIFIRLGLYRAIVRYIGLQALIAILKAIVIYSLLLTLVIFMIDIQNLPRSIPIIQALFATLFIASSRAVARHYLQGVFLGNSGLNSPNRHRIAIYGAGSAGVQLANALKLSREYQPVAFIDEDPELDQRRMGDLLVYAPKQLPELISKQRITEVLLALPSVDRSQRNRIINSLENLPVHVRTLPSLAELAGGKVNVDDLREVEIEDLLGRQPVNPEQSLLSANIQGKVVMVTGAGGSIGSELCRQILDLKPSHLVLYEISEFALYTIEQELIRRSHAQSLGTRILPLLGSVCQQDTLERILKRFRVQTIYHAAAYKHVPMVEHNPCAGAYNNVLGTYRCALAALNCDVETFVLISTDKAVRPTNTMGTSKRFAELTLQALAAAYPHKTRYTMVRFGNVLGSSGSVVPLFRKQIAQGGPITVTDPRIIRYFMTIPEAAQLVIQAGAMGSDGDVFVLDMGEPVKIVDLAERMIHLSGLSVKNEQNPDGDIEIVFSGLRPGEKLYEELLIGDNVIQTAHPRIMRANEKMLTLPTIEALVERLTAACLIGDSDETREVLLSAVEEFSPQCGNEDLLKQ